MSWDNLSSSRLRRPMYIVFPVAIAILGAFINILIVIAKPMHYPIVNDVEGAAGPSYTLAIISTVLVYIVLGGCLTLTLLFAVSSTGASSQKKANKEMTKSIISNSTSTLYQVQRDEPQHDAKPKWANPPAII